MFEKSEYGGIKGHITEEEMREIYDKIIDLDFEKNNELKDVYRIIEHYIAVLSVYDFLSKSGATMQKKPTVEPISPKAYTNEPISFSYNHISYNVVVKGTGRYYKFFLLQDTNWGINNHQVINLNDTNDLPTPIDAFISVNVGMENVEERINQFKINHLKDMFGNVVNDPNYDQAGDLATPIEEPWISIKGILPESYFKNCIRDHVNYFETQLPDNFYSGGTFKLSAPAYAFKYDYNNSSKFDFQNGHNSLEISNGLKHLFNINIYGDFDDDDEEDLPF